MIRLQLALLSSIRRPDNTPMCARYIIHTDHLDPLLLAELFGLVEPPALPSRYNVAPSQLVPVVGAKPDGRRGLSQFKWGFVANWENDAKKAMRPVNAKADTVASSSLFGDSFRKRRCLMIATGFYEWRTVGKRKLPLYYRLRDEKPFAFAGLWDRWAGGAEPLFSCALVTTTPNDLVREVHDRMPVILPPSAFATWLDPRAEVDALQSLLAPYPADGMTMTPANPAVNKSTFEGPECLVPQTESTSVSLW
jgi:putative SOS response-associated peptidase YedK